ncbi:MAG: hypothetical protein A2140_05365 [Candidatus Muproteobacteria bacterium RBG_16_62_13]|uniref:Chaperone NapD n=1 Tax=Candidatus Muproteobacteria bacterium RBG_16_62_13 TaxID=1817756 RepID=A0A1F6T7T8_9PROT|nr:MAG: hypothetical protein A2140_05365 [Candidatus Muproteobacteria bacterium RBG_16_62_13]
MNIAGVLIHSLPGSTETVKHSLTTLPGVEVHAVSADGRMVVTVEGESADALADAFRGFNNMSGVLSAAMVYHHFDSDSGQET